MDIIVIRMIKTGLQKWMARPWRIMKKVHRGRLAANGFRRKQNCGVGVDDNASNHSDNLQEEENEEEEEESPFGGPKPIVPFSSMFILSTTNP